MKKIFMMAVAACMATVSANAQFVLFNLCLDDFSVGFFC